MKIRCEIRKLAFLYNYIRYLICRLNLIKNSSLMNQLATIVHIGNSQVSFLYIDKDLRKRTYVY